MQFHNAIFVGKDKTGTARHAHKKGIYTYGKSYRGNIEGSDPRYSFHWKGISNTLYVFESPIDLISYISLHKEGWENHSYVALCGVGRQSMYQMLKENPNLKTICLCLDSDAPGIKAMRRITDELLELGYQDTKEERSIYKDWNEDCKAVHGQPAQAARTKTGTAMRFRPKEHVLCISLPFLIWTAHLSTPSPIWAAPPTTVLLSGADIRLR